MSDAAKQNGTPRKSPQTSRPATPVPPPVNQPFVQRPARPAAPTQVIRDVSSVQEPVIPQGLSLAEAGLSGFPSFQRPASPALGETIAAQRRQRAEVLRQTLLPSTFVLGITLPLLAAGWFALDRFSVIRDNALGIALPILLAVVGAAFLGVTALLWTQSRRPTPPAGSN
jgi:hypothetical protein